MSDRTFEFCFHLLALLLTLAPFALAVIFIAWLFMYFSRWQKDRATRRELDEAMLAKLNRDQKRNEN